MASKNNRASIFPRLARVLYGPVLALVSILLVLVVFETGLRFFGSSEEAPLIERLLSPDARLIDQLVRLNFSRYRFRAWAEQMQSGQPRIQGPEEGLSLSM